MQLLPFAETLWGNGWRNIPTACPGPPPLGMAGGETAQARGLYFLECWLGLVLATTLKLISHTASRGPEKGAKFRSGLKFLN